MGGADRQLAGHPGAGRAWSAASRPGTTRSTRSSPRSRRRWSPATPWCSSRARWRRSTPSSSPRSSTRSGCPRACSTSCRASARSWARRSRRTHEVDMVSFTGSTRAGKRVAELAAASVKRVALELGGKSANILLDDLDGADLEKAARAGVGACYLNSGQTCSALTRMLVPRSKHDEVVDIVRDEVEKVYTLTDPINGDGPPRPAHLRRPARPGPGLHRQGHRRGRHARHRRRRAARGLRARLLREAHGVRGRRHRR